MRVFRCTRLICNVYFPSEVNLTPAEVKQVNSTLENFRKSPLTMDLFYRIT